MLHPAIKRGLAPALSARPGATFWGQGQVRGQGYTQPQARALLIYEEKMPQYSPKFRRPRTDDCLSEVERDMLKELSENYSLNARQVLEKLKGPFAAGIMPTYPKLSENDTAPRDINCYTDGGVSHPTVPWACLAGIGVWWPTPPGNVDRQIQFPQGDARLSSTILHTKAKDNGTQQWNMLPGQMCSSTRAEIAAATAALTDREAAHVGIDNQGALNNARRLINVAACWEKAWGEDPNWRPPEYPLGNA